MRYRALRCQAQLLSRLLKSRVREIRFRYESRAQHCLNNAHRERTPCLLVTSEHEGKALTRYLIKLRLTRIQIEEDLRDLESCGRRYAFGDSLLAMVCRLGNLLRIGTLAGGRTRRVGRTVQLKH